MMTQVTFLTIKQLEDLTARVHGKNALQTLQTAGDLEPKEKREAVWKFLNNNFGNILLKERTAAVEGRLHTRIMSTDIYA